MAEKDDFNRRIRVTAFATVGFAVGLVFGIILLVGGDWIPGAIIVAATLIGLAVQGPVMRRLRSEAAPSSPPRHTPAH